MSDPMRNTTMAIVLALLLMAAAVFSRAPGETGRRR